MASGILFDGPALYGAERDMERLHADHGRSYGDGSRHIRSGGVGVCEGHPLSVVSGCGLDTPYAVLSYRLCPSGK